LQSSERLPRGFDCVALGTGHQIAGPRKPPGDLIELREAFAVRQPRFRVFRTRVVVHSVLFCVEDAVRHGELYHASVNHESSIEMLPGSRERFGLSPPGSEWLRRLDKTAEQAQILIMRPNLSLVIEGGHANPGDESETLRTMALERDDGTSIVFQILF
jgi:hypothetical protein